MIIFMGVAGAGKSMQGKMLADRVGLAWLSTGEFFRMLVAGERRKEMIAGKLLNDTEVIALVQKIFVVVDTKQQFVLDGFPRTAAQADWLLSQVKYDQLNVDCVILIEASEEVVKDRLLSRGRQDDSEDAITERFKEYRETVLPMLDLFEGVQIPVHRINGDQEVEAVHQDILSALKK